MKSFIRCQRCGIEASPTQKIRACTRCNKVGYCGKLCQRADWKVHKLNCSKPTEVPQQKEEIITRLEKQNDDGTWEDAGPISLLEDGMASSSIIDGDSSINNNNTIPSSKSTTTTTKNLTKELPKRTQFILQSQSNHYKYQHSKDGIDTNLLILLHGAGDTHIPFSNLGKRMELPQTATLSLSASISLNLPEEGRGSFVQLPFGLGHTWYQEMDFITGDKLSTSNTKRLTSLKHALKILDPLICSLIGIDTDDDCDDCWIPERIFLFGFSSGACLAMEFCRMWAKSGRMPLGGAICICGGIHIDQKTDKKSKEPTDVLIITGDDDYPKDVAEQNKQLYDSSKVQIYTKKGRGNGMIDSKEEMQVIMEFLSKRLVRRMTSMEGQSR